MTFKIETDPRFRICVSGNERETESRLLNACTFYVLFSPIAQVVLLTHQSNQLVHASGVAALNLLDELSVLVEKRSRNLGDLEVLLWGYC